MFDTPLFSRESNNNFSSSQDSSCVVSNNFSTSGMVPLICENSRIFSNFSESYLSLNSDRISSFYFFVILSTARKISAINCGSLESKILLM
jgi:hypothetical protein